MLTYNIRLLLSIINTMEAERKGNVPFNTGDHTHCSFFQNWTSFSTYGTLDYCFHFFTPCLYYYNIRHRRTFPVASVVLPIDRMLDPALWLALANRMWAMWQCANSEPRPWETCVFTPCFVFLPSPSDKHTPKHLELDAQTRPTHNPAAWSQPQVNSGQTKVSWTQVRLREPQANPKPMNENN